ncbi:hypothetical protein G6L33_07710 [Agrobacterium rhizogenes]|nr:hypothetical protein [Rhizobium rhizogenes]
MASQSELEQVDGELASTLKEYVSFLPSSEKSFGHATALANYGRQFLPASGAGMAEHRTERHLFSERHRVRA